MKKYVRKAVPALAITLMMLAGCGSSAYDPVQSGIYVSGDGTVQSAEIESFDNSGFEEERYKEDELQQFVEETVSTYNKTSCGQEAAYEKDAEGLDVSIANLTVKDSEAELILKFASCDTYLAFNEGDSAVTALSVTAAADASGAGISLSGMVDGDGNAVDTTSMTGKKYYVVSISGTTELTVRGTVKAVSGDAAVKEKNMVDVGGSALILVKG